MGQTLSQAKKKLVDRSQPAVSIEKNNVITESLKIYSGIVSSKGTNKINNCDFSIEVPIETQMDYDNRKSFKTYI